MSLEHYQFDAGNFPQSRHPIKLPDKYITKSMLCLILSFLFLNFSCRLSNSCTGPGTYIDFNFFARKVIVFWNFENTNNYIVCTNSNRDFPRINLKLNLPLFLCSRVLKFDCHVLGTKTKLYTYQNFENIEVWKFPPKSRLKFSCTM